MPQSGGPERRESIPENTLELPCFIGSLSALRKGNRLLLVNLLIPPNGIAAWVDKEDVRIIEQSTQNDPLKAFLKSNIVSEEEETYYVDIEDRDHPRRIAVPKKWLAKKTVIFQADEIE